MRYSVIVPVYKNESSIGRLVDALSELNHFLEHNLEVVFVVDGSPDKSFEIIKSKVNEVTFKVQLLAHSRNFGSFAAIRTGLIAATGEYFGVMAADLQEPPDLMTKFFENLTSDRCDVVIGTRESRNDPFLSRISAGIFWAIYRKMVVPDMPPGGVDVFGCNQLFRDQLIRLEEAHSSLIALIFWLGFRRQFVSYERQARMSGKSAWTFRKKLDYFMDSFFAFTDYPIRLLISTGALGSIFSIIFGLLVLIAKLSGAITVPGYAATILAVLIFGLLNFLGLGLVGTYAWRAYENSKQRPLAIVAVKYQNHFDTSTEPAS